MTLEECGPIDLVKEALQAARALVETRGLQLRANIEPKLPSLVVDPTRIRQVLFNLLNNAARFTEQGSVAVGVHQDGDRVEFSVSDTGIGIAPGDLDTCRGVSPGGRQHTRTSGRGRVLGLTISKRFVELHGGRIWAESDLGRGSTFLFSLPIRPTGGTSPIPVAAEGREPGAVNEPVLIAVTRSPSAAALLGRHLGGLRVAVAPDLERAEALSIRLSAQAVVIDRACLPPEIEIEALAREWGLPQATFIACPLPGEERLRRQTAVDAYLIKPVSRESTWDVLRRFGEDVDRVLVVDDDKDFVLLMSRLLEDSPVRRYQVSSASGVAEALALLAYRQPDLVMLDLALKDGDGSEVIAAMKANAAWADIPIVAVSGQDAMAEQALLPGALTVARSEGMHLTDCLAWLRAVLAPALTVPAGNGASPPATPQ